MNKTIGILALVLFFAVLLVVTLAPDIRREINTVVYDVKKADDETNYDTIKKVEDTCRAMSASYEADRLTYSQYNGSNNEEQQGWADQAKMRANKTAASYNEYILKNSFVWRDSVPADIRELLEYIQ